MPLHHQVYPHLRREIADGLWEGRGDLPGEREVAERLAISTITSRAALDRMADDGWIERRRGRGLAAAADPASGAADVPRHSQLVEQSLLVNGLLLLRRILDEGSPLIEAGLLAPDGLKTAVTALKQPLLGVPVLEAGRGDHAGPGGTGVPSLRVQ